MYWFLWQTLMLMLLAFFLGASLACLLKRLMAPAVRTAMPIDIRPPLPAAADATRHAPPPDAGLRRVNPLPNLPPRPPMPAPAAMPIGTHVNRFERALAGSQAEPPRPAPQPMPAPVPRPAAPPPAARAEVRAEIPAQRPIPVAPQPPLVPAAPVAPPPAAAGPAPIVVQPKPVIAAAAIAASKSAAPVAPPPAVAGPAPIVVQPKPVFAAATVAATTSTVLTAAAGAYQAAKPAVAAADDLKRIRAIDASIEAALHKLGITQYRQIAGWMKPDIGKVATALGLSPGRIEHENWIEQAQILSSGGETAFSRQRQALQTGAPVLTQALRPAQPPPQAAAPVTALPSSVSAAGSAAAVAGAAAAAAAASAVRSAVGSTTAAGTAVGPPMAGPHVSERAAFANRQTPTPPRVEQPRAAPTAPAASPPPAPAPAAMSGRDNLQRISSISAELERQLNAQGISRYAHIAGWSRDDIGRFDRLLGSDGRISRENWIEQAQILGKGGDTAFSREFDRRTRPGSPASVLPSSAQSISTPTPRIDIASLPSVKSDAYRPRVDAATAAAAAAAAAIGGFRPSRATEVDDLKRIRGIGVLIEKKLNSIGVVSYEQIAQWGNEDIDRVSQMLDFKGRIERENWVEQSRILAAGGDTEFSRRVDRGEVETSKRV